MQENDRCTEKNNVDMYKKSIENPEAFWGEQAARITWFKPWHRVKNTSFHQPISIRWYEGASLNVSYNCIDRHLPHQANTIAILWEPNHPEIPARKITYQNLYEVVGAWSNVLKAHGVQKGDRVTIYLPNIPEAAYAMLACARIGAIHSVVFAGFSATALAGRIQDCDSSFLITANQAQRGDKTIDLKSQADEAAQLCPQLKKIFVVQHTPQPCAWNPTRDLWIHEEVKKVSHECAPTEMDAEDPLFILYTSGSTNKPKGVLHTSGGYLVYAAMTHQYVFDYRPGEVYWCTADVGWITGHSYLVYGPLANGATTLMFEGVPHYPNYSRFWEIVDKHEVNIFYTAPTAIRALMREGDEPVKKTSRKSLRILGTVGEPINPEAWLWYERVVGDSRCPVVDTWWQTETGGICISPLPYATQTKPGSATKPFFGIQPLLVDDAGQTLSGATMGNLCLGDSWPGQMRTVYKDHDRFFETYFSRFPGKYFTGDGASRDADGDYWITGRVDDVLNVSGHRLGTAEIESALVAHPFVAEAAVVGYPDDIKGEAIYAFVTLKTGIEFTLDIETLLKAFVKKNLSAIAAPSVIQNAPNLPKTRSGKIMRRILRKIAVGEFDQLGDTSTLAEPKVVEELIRIRRLKV